MKISLSTIDTICLESKTANTERFSCNCPMVWIGFLNYRDANPLAKLWCAPELDKLDDDMSPCPNTTSYSACPLSRFRPGV